MLELEPLTDRIIGSAIEVHRVLGPGLLESCYETALAIEMGERQLNFQRQPLISVTYKERLVGQCRPDFIIEGQVVVELKCTSRFDPVFHDQVLTYLKVTKLKIGLFMNFHAPTLTAGLKRFGL